MPLQLLPEQSSLSIVTIESSHATEVADNARKGFLMRPPMNSVVRRYSDVVQLWSLFKACFELG